MKLVIGLENEIEFSGSKAVASVYAICSDE